MRQRFSTILLLSCLQMGCMDENCLPVPETDATAPQSEISITYHSTDGSELRAAHMLGDPAITIDADPNQPVTIRYTAMDSSGVRMLAPSLLVQQTVGIGIERQFVSIDPVDASCPTFRISHNEEVLGTGERRTLVLSLSAENWTGKRSIMEPATVHLR